MTHRIPCKSPACTSTILPETAARSDGYCMPCVQAQQHREHDEYIKKNKKIVFTCLFFANWRASNLDSGRGISSLPGMLPLNDVSCANGLCRY